MTHGAGSPVTEYQVPDAEQSQQQLHRILHSNVFRNALTLQQLLQFLAARAIEGSPDGLKEYTIGVEAFGRKPDFDPKTDTIVRVQIHRLRQKLKEYYDDEGRHDPIYVEIPKGHYLPRFEVLTSSSILDLNHEASSQPDAAEAVAAQVREPTAQPSDKNVAAATRRFYALFSLRTTFIAVTIAVFIAGFWLGNKRARMGIDGGPSSHQEAADPVKMFWSGFLGNDSAPIIAYPDAVFLLDDSNDLFRFRQGASDNRGAPVDPHLARQFASNPSLVAKAGPLYYENGYTGTGELEGVAMLAGLFAQMGVKPIVKSSRDVTPDDLKQHNVILLGSPFQNIAVAQLFASGDFVFENPDSQREEWRAQILNSHPGANESPAYHTERDAKTQVLKVDYSLMSIQPGVVPGRYIAILGGLDTTGTGGVTMFATSRAGIEAVSKALAAMGKPLGKDEMPAFQALVRVRLDKGYQVLEANLSAVHMLHPSNAGDSGGPAPQPAASRQ